MTSAVPMPMYMLTSLIGLLEVCPGRRSPTLDHSSRCPSEGAVRIAAIR
jgi:hypothetical protein